MRARTTASSPSTPVTERRYEEFTAQHDWKSVSMWEHCKPSIGTTCGITTGDCVGMYVCTIYFTMVHGSNAFHFIHCFMMGRWSASAKAVHGERIVV